MKEESISVSEFKATCLKLIERVKNSGVPITITKNGKPAARLLPPLAAEEANTLLFGALREDVIEIGDVISPAAEGEWEALK